MIQHREEEDMYFDPGMGSLIIQAVIAFLAVAGGYLVAGKTKFKGLFGKKSKETSETTDKEGSADDTL